MSPMQFGELASRGQAQLHDMEAATPRNAKVFGQTASTYTGPDQQGVWGGVKKQAYEWSRPEWGGGTFDAKTGNDVSFNTPDAHAVTVRMPGQETISVPHDLNEEQFGAHMDRARKTYSKQLAQPGHYLGVFHDTDLGRVDIDPVVVSSGANEQEGRAKAMEIAAATHSTGGAYHFASGEGVWPPHVE